MSDLDLSDLQLLVEREAEVAFPTLEELMVSPEYFGLTTASPVQRAIWRMVDNQPLGELAERDDVLETFGGNIPPQQFYKEFVNLSGIRTAKSMMIAAHAIRASQIVDLSPCLGDGGEIPRYSVLSLEIDNANDVHKHLLGAIYKPKLRGLRLDPREVSQDEEEFLRWVEIIKRTGGTLVGREFLFSREFGRPIEVRIVAGKRAGGSVISKWSAGIALDEAPRMTGYGESVVNLEDTRRAGLGRILDHGQLLMVGSAYEDHGPVYEIYASEFGKPTNSRCIAAAKGYHANPEWWNEERCAALKEADEVAYKMDVLCEFAGAPTQMFPESVQAPIRRDRLEPFLPYDPRVEYVAAMDPATRGNAWTLVIVGRYSKTIEVTDENGKAHPKTVPWDRVAFFTEWVGTPINPVSSRTVFRDSKPILAGYGLDMIVSDQWSIDPLREIADEEGLTILEERMNQEDRVNAYMGVLERAKDMQLEWPDDPKFNRDMKGVRKKPGKKPGDIDIILIKTPDGRHADYAAATVRAHWQMLGEESDVPPEMYSPEWFEHMDRLAEEREMRELREMLDQDELEKFYG